MTLKNFLLETPYFVTQKLGMKLLEMEKDMKIKHSVSPLPTIKVWGIFS